MHCLYSSAPGLVQSLTASSVNVTNITIRWDRVDCQERNGHTDGYRVVYYPTLRSNDRVAWISFGTGDNDRMFSITGLPPQTNYTFEVQASNPNINMRGPPAFYTASTTAPQGKCIIYEECKHLYINCSFSMQALVFSWMVSSMVTIVL